MSVTPSESVVPSTTPTYGLGAATATATPASPTDQMGKDTFLKLMVAQLRNQDPMNPTDSTQFLAQTAQFTSLEKMQDLAAQSSQALNAQMAFGASGLVGKDVTYTAEDGTEATGTVSGVRFTASGPLLHIGDVDVAMNALVAVGTAPAPGDTTGGTPVAPTTDTATDTATTITGPA
ncbi:MAG: flagellar hook capping FlgD N-terminal domain-containing protein [Nocardioidaceae bacterium]